jgi:hypothetical protein
MIRGCPSCQEGEDSGVNDLEFQAGVAGVEVSYMIGDGPMAKEMEQIDLPSQQGSPALDAGQSGAAFASILGDPPKSLTSCTDEELAALARAAGPP